MTTPTNQHAVGEKAYDSFLADIRQFVPSHKIYTDELRTLGWGTDASFYRQIPKVVVRSDSEEQLSKIVRHRIDDGIAEYYLAIVGSSGVVVEHGLNVGV